MSIGKIPGLITNLAAGAAIARRRFVKFGANDDQALLAAASTDAIIGVSTEIDADSGQRCDVILSGPTEIEYGGAVTRGDFLTSDATGRAIKAAPAAGVNARTGGFAAVSGVEGDIGVVVIAPGSIQGAA